MMQSSATQRHISCSSLFGERVQYYIGAFLVRLRQDILGDVKPVIPQMEDVLSLDGEGGHHVLYLLITTECTVT